MSEDIQVNTPAEAQAVEDSRGIAHILKSAEAVQFIERTLNRLIEDAKKDALSKDKAIDASERDVRIRVYHKFDEALSDFLGRKQKEKKSFLIQQNEPQKPTGAL